MAVNAVSHSGVASGPVRCRRQKIRRKARPSASVPSPDCFKAAAIWSSLSPSLTSTWSLLVSWASSSVPPERLIMAILSSYFSLHCDLRTPAFAAASTSGVEAVRPAGRATPPSGHPPTAVVEAIPASNSVLATTVHIGDSSSSRPRVWSWASSLTAAQPSVTTVT